MNQPSDQNHLENDSSQLGLDVDLVRELSQKKLALIIDDDEDTVALLKLTLRREGINVVSATSGQEAIKITSETHPHIILLDIMMPGMDGWETLQQLKRITTVPVVIISAILHEDAVVRAFDEGAAEYIKKPYSRKEIIARIRAILDRTGTHKQYEILVLPLAKVVIDLENHIVSCEGEPIKLTPQEFSVLEILGENQDRPVPYQEIADQVWGKYSTEIHNRLKWVIHSLRKKLSSSGAPEELISNYQRFGYILRDAPL